MNLQAVIPGSAERGNQGRVNVDHTPPVFPDNAVRNHHQTAGQHHQIRPRISQGIQKGLVKGFPGPVCLRGNTVSRNMMFFGPLQGIGPGIVADHSGDSGILYLSAVHSIQYRLEIGSASGDQDRYVQHTSTPFSPACTSPMI